MSVFTTVLSASDGVQVTGSVDIKGQGLITAGIISGSAIAITGSAHLGHPAGQSALVFSRIDSDVQADEQLGSIQFDGRDSNSAGVGAEIRGEAADTWASNDRRATDIKIFSQDNTSGVNTLTGARLTVSSSGGVGADIHIHTPVLQVGTGGDGNQGKTGSGRTIWAILAGAKTSQKDKYLWRYLEKSFYKKRWLVMSRDLVALAEMDDEEDVYNYLKRKL